MAIKSDIQPVTNMLGYKFIDSLDAAEEVARCFMQCGKNRNIIQYQQLVVQYVAAGLWTLAHHLPMRVRMGKVRKGKPERIRYRSKVGDMAHLVVLLSLKPKQVLSFINTDEQAVLYLQNSGILNDGADKADTYFSQLAGHMAAVVTEGRFDEYADLKNSFWVSSASNVLFGETVEPDMFDVTGLNAEEIVKRTRYNVSLVVTRQQPDGGLELKILGERFAALRNLMGYSQKQLAEKLGMTPVMCNRMESGGPVSAPVLLTFLNFYANYFNLDILFDRRMWELAQYKHEVLYKKVHITSVVNRKLKMMKKIITENLNVLQEQVNRDLGNIYHQVKDGMDSAISLTDDD